MDRARHLLKSSVIVIVLLGLGKLTGLIRTRLVSNAFGTSSQFDAFTAANQLPEVFVALISGGALAAAFIPVYSNYLSSKKDKESLWLANSIINLVILILGGISIVGIIFAPWITSTILVPNFSPQLQDLTADIMRVILLQTTLFGVSGVLSSMLNSHQHFALPALAPIALDLGYFIGLVFFVPSMGVIGLAWGTVIGGLIHIIIQIPAVRRFNFRYRPILRLQMPGVREIIRLMGPRIVTLGSVQLVDLFIIRLTSSLVSGSTSGYFYGYYLMQLPETLFATAIAIVVFPTMSELFNSGNIQALKNTSMTVLRIIWTLTIPAAFLIIFLGRPAITFFLQQGAFTLESTNLVYGIVIFFSLRIVSEGSLELLARLFYAQHNTRTPMFVALGWLVTNIILAYLLVDSLGVGGIALASTIAFTFQSLALFILNRRKLGSLGERELLLSLGRSTVASILMSLTIIVVTGLINNPLIQLAIGGTLGVTVYLLSLILIGDKEIPALISLIRNRVY